MSLHPHTQVSPSSKCFSCCYQESVSHAYWMPSDTWLEQVTVPGVKTISPWSAGFSWAMLFCFTCCFVIAGSTQNGSAQACQHVRVEPRARVLFFFFFLILIFLLFLIRHSKVWATSQAQVHSQVEAVPGIEKKLKAITTSFKIKQYSFLQVCPVCVCSISNSILSFIIFFSLNCKWNIQWVNPTNGFAQKGKTYFFLNASNADC